MALVKPLTFSLTIPGSELMHDGDMEDVGTTYYTDMDVSDVFGKSSIQSYEGSQSMRIGSEFGDETLRFKQTDENIEIGVLYQVEGAVYMKSAGNVPTVTDANDVDIGPTFGIEDDWDFYSFEWMATTTSIICSTYFDTGGAGSRTFWDALSVKKIGDRLTFPMRTKDEDNILEVGRLYMQGDIIANSNKVIDNGTPTSTYDAATKGYVDGKTANITYGHPPVRAVAWSTRAVTGTTSLVFNGLTVSAGDRVLLVGQSTASQNGIWLAYTDGYVRPADFDTGDGAYNALVFNQGQSLHASMLWRCTTAAGSDVIDTDSLAFAPINEGGNRVFASASTASPPTTADTIPDELSVWNINSGASCKLFGYDTFGSSMVYVPMTAV